MLRRPRNTTVPHGVLTILSEASCRTALVYPLVADPSGPPVEPVVGGNLGKDPDTVDYVARGVARGVYRAEDLTTAVRDLLHDDSGLAPNRAAYVRDYAFALDGRSAGRVADVMERLMESRPRPK